MLADERSQTLVTNFAEQWLYLRNLASSNPDMRIFAGFDDNLRQAFRRETELFFESVMREDRSVLDLLGADYTFLNERLAKHYGIPNVYGSRFRRVELGESTHRGGLLRQGSILTVTSYGNRTSPVIRGKWILANILGLEPPPPPGNIPALKETTGVEKAVSMRERIAQHRADPACASCHNLMDPIGLAMENYDAVGRWRTHESGTPIDVSGGLPDGSKFEGLAGLQKALLSRPEVFVEHHGGKAYDVFVRPRSGVLRRSGRPQGGSGEPGKGLSVFVAGFGNCQQHAVSNEDNTMIITKKALPRRTFLRGMGTALALPLLDAMVPSMTALAATPANAPRRLGFLYVPMGAHRPTWTLPGNDLTQLSPSLMPLANVRDQCTVVDNMELRNAYPGTHATSNAAFLSAAKSKWTESSDYYLGTTVDQVAAQQLGQGNAAAVA